MRNPLAKLPRLFFENLEHRERGNAMPEFIAHIRDDGTTQSVKDHLEGVAELAAGYARPFGGEKDAWQAGMLHDLGKYSEGFQQHITHPEVVMHIDH